LVTQTGGSCKLAVAEALGADFDAATSAGSDFNSKFVARRFATHLLALALTLAVALAMVVVVVVGWALTAK